MRFVAEAVCAKQYRQLLWYYAGYDGKDKGERHCREKTVNSTFEENP